MNQQCIDLSIIGFRDPHCMIFQPQPRRRAAAPAPASALQSAHKTSHTVDTKMGQKTKHKILNTVKTFDNNIKKPQNSKSHKSRKSRLLCRTNRASHLKSPAQATTTSPSSYAHWASSMGSVGDWDVCVRGTPTAREKYNNRAREAQGESQFSGRAHCRADWGVTRGTECTCEPRGVGGDFVRARP